MNRTTKLLVMFLTLLVVTGAWMSAQRSGDRPSGVPTERWAPLTENSGIVLKDTTRTFNKGWHGILFVKIGNDWHEVSLDSGPVLAVPLS